MLTVQARLAAPAARRALEQASTWTVLQVHAEACNLGGGSDQVVALVTPAVGAGPFSIVVELPQGSSGFTAHLAAGDRGEQRAGSLEVGSLCVQLEGARWVDRPYNEGRALHWGLELDGKVRTDSMGWKGATVKAHLTLPHAQVNDTRLGIQRMARDTPKYVLSAGLDESLPRLQSSYGVSLQLSGRSETDVPGEQRGFTQAKTTLDAFLLYKINSQFKLRLSGQNLLAEDTVRETLYTSAGNTWQLRTMEGGYRTVMATVEGRW